jgi:adenylate cyclase
VIESDTRLLIVEDNKVNRLLLCRSVELLGHRAESAENGRIALDMLAHAPFDLVLLDVEMPDLDGFGVLQAMVAHQELRNVPVIVTSALEGLAEVVRCIELGADDFLHKPVNPALLKARISSSLEKKRLRDQQRQLVSRFATPEVAQDLQQSGFALGGRYVHGSVMFSDIRGFTTLAEKQAPEETIELLNDYYALMFDAITNQGGVVNQIIGDGLMAIFGAPLMVAKPALAAVRAAVKMQEMVGIFNCGRRERECDPIRIGIGIATGKMVAGYTGTHQRATYTCVGDTVHRAARLEAHTKEIGRGIAVDEATFHAVHDRVGMDFMGAVTLKGKTVPTCVYAI